MRNLSRSAVESHEPRIGESFEQLVDLSPRSAFRDDVVDVDAPPRRLPRVADIGQPQEETAEQRSPVLRRPVDNRVRGARDRRLDASGLAVAVQGHRSPVPQLPRRPQGVRQQWQRARLSRDVAHDDVDEAGLELQAREPRRLGNRAPQVVLGHRAEQDLVARHRARERGMRTQLAIDVGAHTDNDGPRVVEERVDVHVPDVDIAAQREELLELVDHHERVGLRPEGCRSVPRRRQLGRRASAQLAGPGRSQDAGAQHR